ncbi:sister chromatid cohesion protein 1 [Coemansia sp. IMI 203386]|nr:sister chromatid cohesion protein 1 [Coemansia sp. IMI 203386]
MFYAEAILSKKGPLAKVWLAAHLERKLTKAQMLQANIPGSVGAIIGQDQGPPLALRLSGQLLLGVSRIYARKARYLLEDCNDALIRIKMAFRPGAADITSDAMVATHTAITLPEALTEFDVLLPSSTRMFGPGGSGSRMGMSMDFGVDMAAAAALNTSRIQDITLAEQSFDVSMVARGAGGVEDLAFGEQDLLGRDDDFRLDLDADFVFSPQQQPIPEPSLGLDASALEPEVGRDAMRGLDESMIGGRAEDISLLGKQIGGLDVQGGGLDISREDLGAGFDGDDVLRFGDDAELAMASGFGDTSIVPNTQEVALQEAEAQVLAAPSHADRPTKRRRLNLSDLVAGDETLLTMDEVRSRMTDSTDIVRVPTYLPPTKTARLEDMSSAAVAMRFLAINSGSPFENLFAASSSEYELMQGTPAALRYDELETSAFAHADDGPNAADADRRESIVPEYPGNDDEFRLDTGDDIVFGDDTVAAGQQLEAEELLANKTFEQLEQLEEESFQRQAEEQHQVGNGISLFANTLPVRDEDISLHVSQLNDTDAHDGSGSPMRSGQSGHSADTGYSKNTIRAIHILDNACKTENITVSDAADAASSADSNATLSYMSVAKDARRTDAVKLFFELLVLKTKDFIDVSQPEPFEDISIAPRTKLRRAAESIQVSRTQESEAIAA